MNVHNRNISGQDAVTPENTALDRPVSKDDARPSSELDARVSADTASSGRSWGGLVLLAARLLAKLVLPILVLAAGYAGYNYFIATKPEPPRKPQLERSFSVRTTPVTIGRVQPTLEVFGSTVSGREVDIRALVAGRVMETSDNLREGGLIEKDTTLLTIDAMDYKTEVDQTAAQLREAEARLEEFKASLAVSKSSLKFALDQQEIAARDVERARPLVARGVTSEKTVDDRQQVLLQRQQAADQLSNEIAVWEARIAQQEAVAQRLKATIARAEQRLIDTKLQSPFDAYVTDVSAQTGRMVGVNDKVATLIDRDWVEARFNLTDDQFGRIISSSGDLVGREVKVLWRLGDTTFTYDAVVERVGARIEAASGGVVVFARLLDPLNPQPIRPGAFVTLQVPDAAFENVAVLPSTALYDGDTVFVVEEGRLKSRKVKVVGVEVKNLLFRGELKDGDKAVTSRISTPGDGVLVKEVAAQ
ncbi:MAG: efflux RND transporter periplasmic adaptor subunit [Pseudomonadota bacterium]